MAISDLSVLISSEQDVQLNKKESVKSTTAVDEENTNSDFFSQLQSANNTLEAPTKVTLSSVSSTSKEETEESTESEEVDNAEDLEPTTSGDAMLAQIMAANNMDTSVNNAAVPTNTGLISPDDLSADDIDANLIGVNTPRPIDKVLPIIDMPTTMDDGSEQQPEQQLKSTLLTEKTVLADAIDQQLKGKGNNKFEQGVTAIIDGVQAKKANESDSALKVSAVPNKDSIDSDVKQTTSKNTESLLASLTPVQRQKLYAEIDAIRGQGVTNSNTTDLKNMLNEFVQINNKSDIKSAAEMTSQLQQLSKDLPLLTPAQKQALSQQLQKFVTTEQPKGALLTQINTVMDELADTELTSKLTETKPQQVSESTIAAYSTKAAEANKTPTSFDAQKMGHQDQLAKHSTQESALTSESYIENEKAESSQPRENAVARVNQLLGQITGQTEPLSSISVTEGSEQSYQQALADLQVINAQQNSPTAQVKQVNLDPSVLQALNIVKSDAAKQLQERVSALLNINNKEAEIRLDPPEMGSMQIRIRSDAEQAHINFVVQNQQAKEALEQSLPRLRELLAQQGIELGESNIQQGNSQGESGADGHQNSQGQLVNQQQNEDHNDATQQKAKTSEQQSSSSIDYYA